MAEAVLLLSGVLVVLRSVKAGAAAMRSANAPGDYGEEKGRLLLAVFGPPMTLATLMFVIAVIAQLTRLAELF